MKCDRCDQVATVAFEVARWHGTPQAGTGEVLPKVLYGCEAYTGYYQHSAAAESAARIYSKGWDRIKDAPTRVDLIDGHHPTPDDDRQYLLSMGGPDDD